MYVLHTCIVDWERQKATTMALHLAMKGSSQAALLIQASQKLKLSFQKFVDPVVDLYEYACPPKDGVKSLEPSCPLNGWKGFAASGT